MKKPISKFHAGMIKAAALGILNAIAVNNHHAVIVKTAKLRILANRLRLNLRQVLPESVFAVIRKVLKQAWSKLCRVSFEYAVAVGMLEVYLTKVITLKSTFEEIVMLVKLPKLPALR